MTIIYPIVLAGTDHSTRTSESVVLYGLSVGKVIGKSLFEAGKLSGMSFADPSRIADFAPKTDMTPRSRRLSLSQ